MMSYQNGIDTINLKFTDKIPRCEYSAHFHWDLVREVTNIDVSSKSNEELRQKASSEFIKKWDYGFFWNVDYSSKIFGDTITKMGHAAYVSDGTDYDTETSNPFMPEDLFDFDPFKTFGAVEMEKEIAYLNNNYDIKVKNNPDCVNVVGIYVTLMSGILEIFGWNNLLMAAAMDKDEFGKLFDRYTDWISQYFNALANSKSDVILIHDDIAWTEGAFIDPSWYRKYVFPNYKKLTSILKEAGKKIIFTSDGNIDEFLDDLIECRFDGFVIEPVTDLQKIVNKCGKTHVIIGGIDTNVLLLGNKEDIYSAVKNTIQIAKDCPGYFIAVGNHIPPNTPIENAIYYNECYEKLARRENICTK